MTLFSREPLTPRRRWGVLTAATALMFLSYSSIVESLGAGDADGAGLLWLGMAVVPFVFLVLAFGSRHPRAPGATGKAMGLFLLVALPLGLANVVAGLVAGFGAGAVIALRPDEGVTSYRRRWIAVASATVYVLVLLLLSSQVPVLAPFAVVSGAVLPLAVVGIADEISTDQAVREHQDATS
jgi:hypothetical protein